MLKFFSGEKQGDVLGVSCSDLGLEVETELHTAHDSIDCLSGIEILQVFGKPLIEQPVIREKLAQMFAGWARYQVLMIPFSIY